LAVAEDRPSVLARIAAGGSRALDAIGRAGDAVVSAVDPIAGARRTAARARTTAFQYIYGTGGYEGARRNRPATKGWDPKADGPVSTLIPDLPTLRARSRDLERNAPIARSVTGTYKARVVGEGLWPRARLDREFLKLTEQQAEALEAKIDRYFWSIAMSGALDYEGRLPWTTMCKLVLGSWLTSGDVFGIRRYLETPGDLIGTKIQLIEADRVGNPTSEPQRVLFADGIERNERGQPIAIHVCDEHPGENGTFGVNAWTRVPIVDEALGDRQVLHIFEPQRIGQPRGEPLFAPVIEYLKQLKRMSDAELQAAVLNAYFTVIVETPLGDGQLGDLEEDGKAKAQPDPDSPIGSDITLGSGTVAYTAAGEKINFADPKRPNPNVDSFVRAFCGYVGAATGIPREVLLKEFTASYSAARAALLDMWSSVIDRRTVLVDQFAQPVYEWVLGELVDRGILEMPGFHDDPIVRQAWCETEWHGPTMGQIDPVDEIDAAERRVSLTVSTLERETAQLTGGDWASNLKQRAKEVRLLKESGLDVEQTADRPAHAQQPQQDGDLETPPAPPRRSINEPESRMRRHRLRGDARDAAELSAQRRTP
jgi:lambda family phage portal protein